MAEKDTGEGQAPKGRATVQVQVQTAQFGARGRMVQVPGPLTSILCTSEDPNGDIQVEVVRDTLILTVMYGTNVLATVLLERGQG